MIPLLEFGAEKRLLGPPDVEGEVWAAEFH